VRLFERVLGTDEEWKRKNRLTSWLKVKNVGCIVDEDEAFADTKVVAVVVVVE
jgi:hypothetical protein